MAADGMFATRTFPVTALEAEGDDGTDIVFTFGVAPLSGFLLRSFIASFA